MEASVEENFSLTGFGKIYFCFFNPGTHLVSTDLFENVFSIQDISVTCKTLIIFVYFDQAESLDKITTLINAASGLLGRFGWDTNLKEGDEIIKTQIFGFTSSSTKYSKIMKDGCNAANGFVVVLKKNNNSSITQSEREQVTTGMLKFLSET